MTLSRLMLLLLAATLLLGQALADEGRWPQHVLAAQAALSRGDYAAAETHTEAALDAAESFGPQDWRLALTLDKLASFYRARGRYDEAARLYRRLLAMEDETLGRNHPRAIARANDLAAIYRHQGRRADADRLLRDRN